MSIVVSGSGGNLQALWTIFDLRYQSVFQATEIYADKLAMTIPSSSEQNTYPWIGKLPVVREWLNDRVVNNAYAKSYTLVNALFESTQGLNKSKLDDDQWGLFASQIIPLMAEQMRKWPDYRIVDKILANGEWSDGERFFAEAHPVNVDDASMGTYANDFENLPLTHENYATARARMRKRKGEDGKSLGVNPNLLIVGPENEEQAKQITKATMIAPGSFRNESDQVGAITNTQIGTAEVIVIPELTNDDAFDGFWYLADTRRPIKPFIWQLREAPSFAMRVDPRDPVVFDRNEYLFGTRARGEAGYGFPWMCDRFSPRAFA